MSDVQNTKENIDKSFGKGKQKIVENYCYTIATKQTRTPNAGLIYLGNEEYRYLTEKECFLLMGFEEKDYEILKKVHKKKKEKMSSILYKQSGNSIVVNVLEKIMINIVKDL